MLWVVTVKQDSNQRSKTAILLKISSKFYFFAHKLLFCNFNAVTFTAAIFFEYFKTLYQKVFFNDFFSCM